MMEIQQVQLSQWAGVSGKGGADKMGIMQKILYSLVFVVFLAATAMSAAATNAEGFWQNNAKTITIDEGESVYFDYVVYTSEPPVTFSVLFYDSQSPSPIHVYESNRVSQNKLNTARITVDSLHYGNKAGTYTVFIGGSDSVGHPDNDILTLTVNPLLTASITTPADGDNFIAGDLILFSGYGNDPDNDTLTYEWVSDLDGVLSTQTSFTRALSLGQHTITFSVTNADGTQVSDSIIIFVKSSDAPILSITAPLNEQDFVLGQSITFTAEASDPDGTIASYQWVSSLDNVIGSAALFTRSDLSLGRHNIILTVTDNDGLTAQDSIMIDVKVLTAPTAVISSPRNGDVFTQGDNILFDGSASYDPDGSIVSYLWSSDLNGVIGNDAAFTRSDLSLGKHDITLTVTDDDALQYTDTFTLWIIINSVYSPDITITTAETDFREGDLIIFDAVITIPGGGIITDYSWASDILGVLSSGSGTNAGFTATLPAGLHTISLTAMADNGYAGHDFIFLTIFGVGHPLADAGGPYFAYEDEDIEFDGSSSKDNGTIVSYDWSFGDGSTSTSIRPTHDYNSPGDYVVSLTITDNDGLTHTDTTYAHITSQPILTAVRVDAIRMPDYMDAGSELQITVRFENSGNTKLEHVSASAVIQELGLKDSVGPFDLKKGKEQTGVLSLEIPEWASGEYDVRVVISNDDVRRVVYRIVTIE